MRKDPWFLGLEVVVLAGFLTAAPQKPAAVSSAKPDFSKEASVIESYVTAIRFENDGTQTRDTTVKVRIQSDAGVQAYSVLTGAYGSATERFQYDYVRVRQPDGTVVTTPASDIQDMTSEVTRQAPEYSDLREKHVAVKGLVPGSILEYQVHDQVFAPLVPGQFWLSYDFTKTGILLEEELQVNVPKDRPLRMKSTSVQPTSEVRGDRRIYTWKSSNLKNEDQPPHQLGDVPPPDVLLSTFQTWDEVGRWWAGLEKPQMAPTPEIRAKAAELTKGLTTEDAKLRAIYEYVARNFHYIGISFGIGRYQPHTAKEVLNNAFGDCKDKHTLLASLLQAAGIEAWPVLISSMRRIDPDVPSPGQFDHVITVVPEKGKLEWMDTTSELAPLGMLIFPLRGKEALVIPDAQPAHLAMTPAQPSQPDASSFDFDGTLTDAGGMTAKVRMTASGDGGLATRLVFRNTAQSEWQKLAQGISYAFGFGGTVSDVNASSPDDPDHPFNISYDYSRKQLGDWQNHRTTAPLPPISLPGVSEEKEKASFPIILGVPSRADYQCKVELPKGYTATLPDAVDLVKPYAEYHSAYSFKDGVLRAERHIVVKEGQVPAAEREDYRAFQKAVSDDQNQFIVFNTSSETTPRAMSNPQFKDAMQEAWGDFRQGNYRSAESAIKRATDAEPDSEQAWGIAASIYAMMDKTDEAIAALHKAIAIAPKDFKAYAQLSFVLASAHRDEEMVDAWRGLVQHDPDNAQAHYSLGAALTHNKRYQEAIAEYETAGKLDPKEWQYQLGLGDAYAGAGDGDKAVAAYEKAAQLNPSPLCWNDVGYSMAQNNLKLAEAEHFAKMAVEGEENDTSKMSLDNLQEVDLARMESLAAFWDTLAWVNFRESKFDDARKYEEASWMIHQEPTSGDHLAQIEEKLGHQQAAINDYAFAMALGGGETYKVKVPGIKPPPYDGLARMRSRLEALAGKNKVDSLIRSRDLELSKLREYTFDKGDLKPGSADFFVLIAPGELVRGVKFVSGDEVLKPAAKALESIHFNQSFPDDNPALILRRGILSCDKVTPKCDFVLYPLEDVRSVK